MARDTCRWVLSRIPLHAGGELLGLDRRRIERHVIGCEACRARLEKQRAALESLHALAQVDPHPAGASLWPALKRQIDETRRQPRPWVLRMPRRWAVAAAAAVLLLVGTAAAWQVGRHYQFFIGFRPRMARVDPRPVFRPAHSDSTPPVATNTSARPTPTSDTDARSDVARTPATATRDRRPSTVPTN